MSSSVFKSGNSIRDVQWCPPRFNDFFFAAADESGNVHVSIDGLPRCLLLLKQNSNIIHPSFQPPTPLTKKRGVNEKKEYCLIV